MLLAAGATLLVLSACTATYRSSGYVPTETELEQLEVGRSDRAAVEEIVGRPATNGVIRDQTWYFVGSLWETFAYRRPIPVERQVVAISFNDQGTIANIERFALEDGEVIALNRRVTDSSIAGVSLVRQLLGNIGNIDPTQALGGAAPN